MRLVLVYIIAGTVVDSYWIATYPRQSEAKCSLQNVLNSARNAPNSFDRSLQDSPDPLAGFRGAASWRGKRETNVGEREKREGKGKGEGSEWRRGKGREGLCTLTLM